MEEEIRHVPDTNVPEGKIAPVPGEPPVPLPMEGMTGIGYLTVSTGTGGKAYPLTDARAEIFLPDEDGEYRLYRTMSTGSTGIAARISVPTPQAEMSQSPDSAYLPYTIARIRVYREGYYPVEAKEVPVFPGITSLQYFDMIPYAEGTGSQNPGDGYTSELIVVSEDTENAL
ncbi:MAG: hypothetical protein MJ175_10770 [Clostridia bacterium]|nr:hypothetical protein [Clostridia bacterium]